jgi:VWFA-related protein
MNGYRRFSVRIFRCCLSACLLCPSVGSAAQVKSQSTQPSQTTAASASTLQVKANLVLVDVVVTNGGIAAGGLPKDKFHIFEDGNPQQITTFEEHRPEDSPTVSKIPSLGPNIYSDFPEFAITSAANVLLLDALNTPLSDQMYVRQQMTRYLRTIPPGTRVAVFTLASRLRMVEGFTTDSTVLAKALSGEGGGQQSVMLDGAAQSAGMSDSISGPGPVERASSSLQQFAADLASFQTDIRVQMTLDAMKDLARYLNVIPGRKNLIWFSGSFPLAIDPDAAQSRSFTAMRNYADDVRETSGLLAAARVAVYPVDARGLMSLPSASAASRFTPVSSGPPMPGKENQGSGNAHAPINARGGTGTGLSPAASADQKFLKQTAIEHATMQQIAEDTGGKAFLDTNGVKEAVGQAIANGTRYYTLGYIPQMIKNDGSFRRIKVNVEGSYQLSYRRGYYAYDSLRIGASSSPSSNLMREAVQYGAPPLSEIPFKVRVIATGDPAAKGTAISPEPAGVESRNLSLKGTKERYLVDYAVDAHKIAYTTTTPDGVRQARIEFAVAAYDGNGKLLNHADQGIEMKLNTALYEQVARLGLPMHQEIDLPPGHVFLRVVVHDMVGGRIGASEIPLTVTK